MDQVHEVEDSTPSVPWTLYDRHTVHKVTTSVNILSLRKKERTWDKQTVILHVYCAPIIQCSDKATSLQEMEYGLMELTIRHIDVRTRQRVLWCHTGGKRLSASLEGLWCTIWEDNDVDGLIILKWILHQRSDSYRILVMKPEGKSTLGRPAHRWWKIFRWSSGSGKWGVNWIDVAHGRDKWWVRVNAAMNIRVTWNGGNFLTLVLWNYLIILYIYVFVYFLAYGLSSNCSVQLVFRHVWVS